MLELSDWLVFIHLHISLVKVDSELASSIVNLIQYSWTIFNNFEDIKTTLRYFGDISFFKWLMKNVLKLLLFTRVV